MRLKYYQKIMNYSILALMIISKGLWAQNSDSSQQYNDLKNSAFQQETLGGEHISERDLTTDISLEKLLTYAAYHNPELEAAFDRWKAALEKIPQVRALPDPRLTYAYYIENVETRVGPQRHRLDLSQTFPWFGKLDTPTPGVPSPRLRGHASCERPACSRPYGFRFAQQA